MLPKEFQEIGRRAASEIIRPLDERLHAVRTEADTIENILRRHRRFATWHKYLVNGITPAGFCGACPTNGMFVRRYRAEPRTQSWRKPRLIDVDLVIVPEVLVAHHIRVNVPHATQPGISTNTSAMVDVPGLVGHMLDDAKHAKNVSVGTLDDVAHEACTTCGASAILAGIDELIDADDGYEFIVGALCHRCSLVDEKAFFSEYVDERPQWSFTTGIYRHT